MSNSAKLKKKAADYEAKKQFDKALEVYEQVLNTARAGDEERDVPLYNRVGDLHYRLGNNEQAINYYEKAADLYAEGGFFNNAIALCNKILRYSPGRTIVYYKLGLISAKKGFNERREAEFPRVRRPHAATRQDGRCVPGAEGVRGPLSRPG